MIGFVKRASHLVIGFLSGLHAEKPAALVATLGFLGYQFIEQQAIHDKGYPEVREWSFGFSLGLGVRWLRRRIARRRDMPVGTKTIYLHDDRRRNIDAMERLAFDLEKQGDSPELVKDCLLYTSPSPRD